MSDAMLGRRAFLAKSAALLGLGVGTSLGSIPFLDAVAHADDDVFGAGLTKLLKKKGPLLKTASFGIEEESRQIGFSSAQAVLGYKVVLFQYGSADAPTMVDVGGVKVRKDEPLALATVDHEAKDKKSGELELVCAPMVLSAENLTKLNTYYDSIRKLLCARAKGEAAKLDLKTLKAKDPLMRPDVEDPSSICKKSDTDEERDAKLQAILVGGDSATPRQRQINMSVPLVSLARGVYQQDKAKRIKLSACPYVDYHSAAGRKEHVQQMFVNAAKWVKANASGNDAFDQHVLAFLILLQMTSFIATDGEKDKIGLLPKVDTTKMLAALDTKFAASVGANAMTAVLGKVTAATFPGKKFDATKPYVVAQNLADIAAGREHFGGGQGACLPVLELGAGKEPGLVMEFRDGHSELAKASFENAITWATPFI